jgi:putative ABC transport system permease protein
VSKALSIGSRIATVPLARRNILSDKSRLLRSASGIAFAVFLMLVQLGFQSAFINSTLDLIRKFDADIVLTSSLKYQLGKKAPFARRFLYQARVVPGVATARPVYAEWTSSTWQNPQTGHRYFMQVFAFDPDEPTFLIPEVNADLDALRQPNTVLMDTRARRFFGGARIGLESELARHRVKIVGHFPLGPDFFTDGTMITSDRNFETLFPPPNPQPGTRSDLPTQLPDVEMGFVKVAPGYDVATVQRNLRAALPPTIKVQTRQQLIDQEAAFQARFSGVGPIFGVGAMIGFAVGMMIAYQILYNDISDQLSQYATLKAMGYNNRYLAAVVLQQAVFYGVVGYVPALLTCLVLFKFIGDLLLLPMRVTPYIFTVSTTLTVGMCIISGLIAVRRVIQADPAEVF